MCEIPANLYAQYPDNCDSHHLEINVYKYSEFLCSHEFALRNSSESHSSLWNCRFHSPISPMPLLSPSMDKFNPLVPSNNVSCSMPLLPFVVVH